MKLKRFNTVVRLVLVVIFYFIVMYCFLGTLLLAGGVEKVQTDYAFLAVMNILIGLILPASTLFFYKIVDRGNPFELGFTFRKKDFAFSIIVCLIALLTLAGLLWIKSFEESIGMSFHFDKLNSVPFLLLLAFACIAWMVSVLQEEVLVKGYFFANLHHLGIIGMLIVSNIIFSLTHIPTKGFHPIELLIHFVGGLAYGYIYLKSGSLFVSTIVHGFHNFILDILFNANYDVTLVTFNSALTDVDKLILQIVTAILLLIATYLIYGRQNGILTPADNLQRVWYNNNVMTTQKNSYNHAP